MWTYFLGLPVVQDHYISLFNNFELIGFNSGEVQSYNGFPHKTDLGPGYRISETDSVDLIRTTENFFPFQDANRREIEAEKSVSEKENHCYKTGLVPSMIHSARLTGKHCFPLKFVLFA